MRRKLKETKVNFVSPVSIHNSYPVGRDNVLLDRNHKCGTHDKSQSNPILNQPQSREGKTEGCGHTDRRALKFEKEVSWFT